MDNRKFWWLLVMAALITTWLVLISKAAEKLRCQYRIENHSEITTNTLKDN